MTSNALAKPCTNSPKVSVTDQSSSKLQAAIRGAHDAGAVLKRVNQCLASFYDPALGDPATMAGVREEFVRGLEKFPTWAIMRAFDAWMRTRTRRPSVAEIGILVSQELQPMRDELARREKEDRERAEHAERKARSKASPEAAQRIMAQFGFTQTRLDAVRGHPMARSEADLNAAQAAVDDRHWSEKADPDSPEIAALKAARDANPMVRAAREAQAKARGREGVDLPSKGGAADSA